MEDSSEIGPEEPLLRSSPNKGGIKTLPFIVANESLLCLATTGLSPNMTRYLMAEYNMSTAHTSNLLFFSSSANGFTPIVGAFLSDAYTGRFRIIAFGTIFSLLGMTLLWLTATIPEARPSCDKFTGVCNSPTPLQLLLLYTCFGLMSIGAGGIQGSSLAFGGDQLNNKRHNENAGLLESFISWYYVGTLVGSLLGMTLIVYIQDKMGWSVGFGIPVVLMFFSMVSFFMASPFYVKKKPTASLFTGILQVIVASYRKRKLELLSNGSHQLFHHDRGSSSLLKPSEKLRFLNKACVTVNPEEDATSDPWSVCTVEQVENLKAIIRLIPIWSAGIMFAVSFNQNTLPYLQISTMDRHITTNFEVPAGSFTTFLFIGLGIWVTLYDRLLIPLATKIRGKPTRMTPRQKIGFGIFCSGMSLAVSAIVERKRRAMAVAEGLSDDPHGVVKMSAFWLLPHYALAAVADASCMIGQNELFYSEVPASMASIATSLVGLGMSAGSLAASLIMTVVDIVTKGGGGESWISSNINKGHYDYYFWVISGLCFLDFLYFVACSKGFVTATRRNHDGEDEESV